MRVDPEFLDPQAADGTALPRPNRRLTALAHTLACRAEPLLPRKSGILLGVTRKEEEQILLSWWDCEFRVVSDLRAAPREFRPASTAEGALQRAGRALLRYFAGRWPEGMVPADLGVITDGVGVAFAPDDPAPTASGWMLRHATGQAVLRTILPMAATGPAALLLPTPGTVKIH